MSKRELISRELDRLPEQNIDLLLAFLRSLNEGPAASGAPILPIKAKHANDWLTPEDEAWAEL